MITLILIATVILALSVVVYKKYAPYYRLARQYPGPPALPLIGCAYHLIGRSPDYIAAKLMEWAEYYGDTYCIWFGMQLLITLHDVNDMEVVLSSTKLIEKADVYQFLRNWLRDGLLLSGGRKWFQRRKLLTPAFHFKILEAFIPDMERQAKIMIQQIRLKTVPASENGFAAQHKMNGDVPLVAPKTQAFDLFNVIGLCTLDIICESSMGVSKNAQTNSDSDYVKAVNTITKVLHLRMYDIFRRLDIMHRFTKLAQEEKKALKILHGFTEKIISERREELLKIQQQKQMTTTNEQENLSNGHNIAANGKYNQQATDVDADRIGSKKRNTAFLDLLLQSKIDDKPLSNLDIREEVDTFMFEGHDTTSTALTFFFYNMATNMQCQERCVQELLQVFGSAEAETEEPLTCENLNRLPYIDACIKETLRLFPPVPLLGRHVVKDCNINGKLIPAGTTIGISPLTLGRSEKLFPQAKQFIPERFSDAQNDSMQKINRFAYIPFSAGARNCIGQKFAMFEMKCIITHVLRNFVVEYAGDPNEKLVLIGEVILRSRDPLMFRMRPRIY